MNSKVDFASGGIAIDKERVLIVKNRPDPGRGGDGYWGSIGTSNNRKITLEMDIESEPSKEFALPDGVISSSSNIICKLTKHHIVATICMKNFVIGSNGRLMLRFS